jgi:hypothetical protein
MKLSELFLRIFQVHENQIAISEIGGGRDNLVNYVDPFNDILISYIEKRKNATNIGRQLYFKRIG